VWGEGMNTLANHIKPDKSGWGSPFQRALGNSQRGDLSPRSATIIWRPDKSLSSGIYLVRATIGKQTIAKRIVYLK